MGKRDAGVFDAVPRKCWTYRDFAVEGKDYTYGSRGGWNEISKISRKRRVKTTLWELNLTLES